MTKNGKILACVDRSHFADTVADAASWAARRLAAPLEFLQVIDRHPELGSGEDHSGAIGIDAQENLLAELSDRDAVLARAAREQGRVFLNRLRERAIAAGVAAPDVRLRHGELEASLVDLEAGAGLFVLGRRGESAEISQRDLGRNVERIVRALHRPILAVTEGFAEPRRFMIAFDGGVVTRRGVEMIASSPLFAGLPCELLMSGKPVADGPRQLEWARQTLATAGFDVDARLVPGDAESIVAREVVARGVDLLVMGAFKHSPVRSLLLGSRTTDLLRSARVPTLLLR